MQQKHSFRKNTFDLLPEIHHLARKEELGELNKVYSISKQKTFIFGIGMSCIFLSVFLVLPVISALIYSDISSLMAEAVLAFILLTVGLYITLSRSIYRSIYAHWHISLWQYGFIYEKKQICQVFRWNQIESILGGLNLGPTGQNTYLYKVRRRDGYEVKIGNEFLDIAEFVDTLLGESARQLATRELSIVSRSNISTFTNIKLDQQGISSAQEKLSWEEIQEFATKNGMVTLHKQEE